MKYAANQEGVTALRTMSKAVRESLEALAGHTATMKSTADGATDIGPHKPSIVSALEEIGESVKKASEPTESVAEHLDDVADGYEETIGNDRFSGLGGN